MIRDGDTTFFLAEPEDDATLFFHHQKNPKRNYRRVRKEPDDLPQALRYFKYANLNPRIAAFLGKQDPKNAGKRNKALRNGEDAGDGSGDEKASAGFGGLLNFGDGLSQEARSLLPDIGNDLSLVNMGMFDDSGAPSRASMNEADDPQRYQFEQMTFAAPNILKELSETLERFKHLFIEYEKRLQHNKSADDGGLSAVKLRQANFLPAGLSYILCEDWTDLIAEAVYTHRVWQSQAYKSGYKYAPTLASGRHITTASGHSAGEKDGTAKRDMKNMVDLLADTRPKQRSEVMVKFEGIGKKKKKEGVEDIRSISHKLEVVEPKHRYTANPTISFNLSTNKAFEEGWVVNHTQEADLEQDNALQWATSRLQMAMKEKEAENASMKSRGCDRPTLLRYYGDSRRDTLMKLYRKSNENEVLSQIRKQNIMPKIPQLSKMENSDRQQFLVQLPDGSTTIYYPTQARVAVMSSAVPDFPGQYYTHCYDNDEERTCLASFTPYGKSCCYHKNGNAGLVLGDLGGVLKSEDGSIIKKWLWPKYGGKLKENVIFLLNKEMYIRVMARDQVLLSFACNRETSKLMVGVARNIDASSNLSPEHQATLQSGLKFASKAAMEYGSYRREDKRPKHKKFYGLKKSKKHQDIEDLKRSMEPPERFEYESQADKELQRLQSKSKVLVEDWMEHYRIAAGITSPALKKLFDKPVAKGVRKVQSAKERKSSWVVSTDDGDETVSLTRYQSYRSPSAPPKHLATAVPKRPGLEDKQGKEVGKKVTMKEQTTEQTEEMHKSPEHGAEAVKQHSSATTHLRSAKSSLKKPSTANTTALQRTEKTWIPAPEACPVVTRMKLMNQDPQAEKKFMCKCSKHKIPQVNDVEYDCFLREVAPSLQIIVISVFNSMHPYDTSPYNAMLEKLYLDKNKNRTKPCSQCRHDQYRIVRYDLATAKLGTNKAKPLLLERHNAVPGMSLMYCSGRLLFADHIFNGYGNARKDFFKQVFKCRKDFHLGFYLPDDFRFTPSRGKKGARAAWGGEIGGTGVMLKGKPGLIGGRQTVAAVTIRKSPDGDGLKRATKSASYSSTSISDITSNASKIKHLQASSFDTAREFIQYSLSTKMYTTPPPISNTNLHQVHTQESLHHPVENSSNSSHLATETVVSQIGNLSRMQAVK